MAKRKTKFRIKKSSIKRFSKRKGVTELFKAIGHPDYKFGGLLYEHPLQDGSSHAIALKIASDQAGQESSALLYLLFDIPTWSNIMDLRFGVGKYCDIQIILSPPFEDEDLEMMQSAVKISNDFGDPAYIVKDHVDRLELVDPPTVCNDTELLNRPTEEEYKAAEFWVCYHDVGSIVHGARVVHPGWWFDPRFDFTCDLYGYTVAWEEDGLFIFMLTSDPKNRELLIKFYNANKDALEKTFKGRVVVYLKMKDRDLIAIRLLQTPIGVFGSLHEKEKINIASLVYESEVEISSLLTEFQEKR